MFVTRRTVRRFLRLASTKDAAWTCTYESPRGRGLSVLWGGRPAGFAGLCVTLFHCLSSCRTVSRSGCPVWRSHWQRLQIPTLPHPLQLPLLSGSWIPARRGGMKWYFTVVLVCVFLGMSDVRVLSSCSASYVNKTFSKYLCAASSLKPPSVNTEACSVLSCPPSTESLILAHNGDGAISKRSTKSLGRRMCWLLRACPVPPQPTPPSWG
uniref:Uncharacterized protein n=1 Tax=Mustela putorius furo TaxID=9669 RepID=M3XTS1_MUSPF